MIKKRINKMMIVIMKKKLRPIKINFTMRKEILNGTHHLTNLLKAAVIQNHLQMKKRKVIMMKWKKEKMKYGTLIFLKERL
jgi:hypothetical protein